MTLLASANFLIANFLIGCASQQESPSSWTPGPIEIHTEEFVGAPLSGLQPIPDEGLVDPNPLVEVSIALWALRDLPIRDSLIPLEQATQFVAAPENLVPVLPVSQLARGARYRMIAGKESREWAQKIQRGELGPSRFLDVVTGVLDARTTFSVSTRPMNDRSRTRLTVLAAGQGGRDKQPCLYLELRGKTVPDDPEIEIGEEEAKEPPQWLHEIVVMSQFDDSLIIVPARYFGDSYQAIAAVIHVASIQQASPSRDQAIARWTPKDSKEAAPPPVSPLLVLMKNLINPPKQRSTLLHIAVESGASLTESVAYTAPQPFIQTLGRAIEKEANSSSIPLGLLMDKITLKVSAGHLDKETLPPAVAGVLVQECGEAGRIPDTLRGLAARMKDRDDFHRRLVAENLFSLEDNDPSARVRAYDWLRARDIAPLDFDPLGSRDDRRQAIQTYNRLQEQQQTESAGEGQQP